MRKLLLCGFGAASLVVLALLATGFTSSRSSNASSSDVLRVGTINEIDTLNPFAYIESQSFAAYVEVYPQIVQIEKKGESYVPVPDLATKWTTSKDGKTLTFAIRSDGKWSDGKPITADDAAWTLNTIIKYQKTTTAAYAGVVNHLKKATAKSATSLVLSYDSPVANALTQLQQTIVLPKHVWSKIPGKELKRHPVKIPFVSGGPFEMVKFEVKGTSAFKANPDFYGPKAQVKGLALTYYTNTDAMLADLKGGKLDWVDEIPSSAVKKLSEDANLVVQKQIGAQTNNITWNSNPAKPKNRELLDPKVKHALSQSVDRQRIIDVVFGGNAVLVESLPGKIAGALENAKLGPLVFDQKAANSALDKLGYKRGSDGTRVAPATKGKYAQKAHKMSYEIITPTSVNFNIDRAFEVVKDGFSKIGVKVTQRVGGDTSATYELETDSDCKYRKFDIAMWDWIGYADPDFMLAAVTKDQWCSWSDTGWDNPAYDKLYKKQSTLVDAAKRKALVWKMQQIIYDNVLYTQLNNMFLIDVHAKGWDGFPTELSAYSKRYWTDPHTVS